ncbi:MAG TPA: hypothetical protein PKW79_05920 [Rhabdochlamydiaceae bacterium]|nr:hypothetical protein [Rhabdochlamydiaceae bacterium]
MAGDFDFEAAKKSLRLKEERENEHKEEERLHFLQRAKTILEKEFKGTGVEVYLVGSILQPSRFTSMSDIDIVLKNFHGDRFELWAKLDRQIGRTVEIIIFETCHFQDFVLKDGLKVV